MFSIYVCSSVCPVLSPFTILSSRPFHRRFHQFPVYRRERSCANLEAVLGRNPCSTSHSDHTEGGVCSSLILFFYVSERLWGYFVDLLTSSLHTRLNLERTRPRYCKVGATSPQYSFTSSGVRAECLYLKNALQYKSLCLPSESSLIARPVVQ